MLLVFIAAGPVTDALGARAVYAISAATLVLAALTAFRLLPRPAPA
jgi:hypothetical protein